MKQKIEFGKTLVSQVRKLLVEKPTTIDAEAPIDDLLRSFIDDPRVRHVHVVDFSGKLIGSVRMNTIVHYLFPVSAMIESRQDILKHSYLFFRVQTVREIMDSSLRFVTENTTLSDVARILIEEKINELPVVDNDRKVIGQINMYEMIKAYLSTKETS